jgi:hypothetical protein
MNAPRIRDVKPLPDHRILATFVNGVQKIYDCKPLLHRDNFRLLRDEAFFKSVAVDAGGYGISWNDDADLSEYELWTRGNEYPANPTVHQTLLQETR